MTRILLRLFAIACFAFFMMPVSGSFADEAGTADTITPEMVREKYARMEKALNERDDAMAVIRLLHAQYSEDAIFRLTVSNPQQAGGGDSPVMEMDKQSYINSFVHGAHAIGGYRLKIETMRFEFNAGSAEATTEDVITERGMMLGSTAGAGQPFVSTTTCRTRHALRAGALVSTGGTCHTDIQFEEDA